MRRWRPLNVDIKSDIELVLKANNIQVCNDQKAALLVTEEMKEAFNRYWYSHKYQELTGRNHILASFCPQVLKIENDLLLCRRFIFSLNIKTGLWVVLGKASHCYCPCWWSSKVR